MSLSDIVSVSITRATRFPSKAGFGTPIIVGYHTNYVDRVRSYASLTEMVDDGFSVNDPIYKAALKLFGQNPKVKKVKVGRRALPPTQKFQWAPVSTLEDLVHSITFVAPDGTTDTAEYTNGGAETVATIIDGMKIAIDALGFDLTTVDNTTSLNINADNAGELFDVLVNNRPLAEYTLKNVTTDPGIATDLAAIILVDSDWYGLILDSNSKAEVVAAAAQAETYFAIMFIDSCDTEILDPADVDDLFTTLKASAYARTFGIWSKHSLSYAGAGVAGVHLPTDPGKAIVKFKTVAGLAADTLTSAQENSVKGKYGSVYVTIAAVNMIDEGKVFANEWVDVIRFVDFLQARIQERVFALLLNQPKLPYTDASVDLVKAEILSMLNSTVPYGLAPDPAPNVTAPLVADVDPADRQARLLPDVEFTARLAGAIQATEISGTLSV